MLHYTKRFLLKNPFFMFLGNFISVVLHLKIHPAVHLIKYFESSDVIVVKKKSLKFTSFRYSYVLARVKKNIMVADKNSNIITLATKIIMLL